MSPTSTGRDFFGCTENELEERDAAIAASRKAYEEHRAEELSLGPPIGASEILPEPLGPLALSLNVADNLFRSDNITIDSPILVELSSRMHFSFRQIVFTFLDS